jgi:hypothetical protein
MTACHVKLAVRFFLTRPEFFHSMSTIRFFCVICGTALQASADSHYDLATCHSCTRYIPVPRPVSLPGKFTRYQPVLPPKVLELSVTFQCEACGSRLRADARREGRQIVCPVCAGTTAVPRWSNVPGWSPAAVSEKVRVEAPRPPARTNAATLSIEEINFLRGEASGEAV